jgi:ABC-type multidrug transport system fused ATPase/permease subunit
MIGNQNGTQYPQSIIQSTVQTTVQSTIQPIYQAPNNNNNVSGQNLIAPKIQPIDIVFQNLSYTIMVKDENTNMCSRLPPVKKEILKGVTGLIQHGKVTAIMGASGAGKTSLLNIMACRISKSRTVKI